MNEQQEFEAWWYADCDTRENPYSQHSMMYWAWEGWKTGRAAENEACAKLMSTLTCMGNAKECFEVAATYIRARREQ